MVMGAGFYIGACSLVCNTNSLLYLSQAFSVNCDKSTLFMSSLIKGYVLKEEHAGLNLFFKDYFGMKTKATHWKIGTC